MNWGKNLRKRVYLYICITVFLVIAGSICFSAHTEKVQKKEDAYHMLELYSVRIESLLNSLFHKTDILESVVIMNHGQIDKEIFDNLSASLMEGEGIRAIQYLPDGIVTYCYPLEGNESSIGDNVFQLPKRREDALLAVQTREISLSGPYNLTQGGFGLVARNPIFLEGEDREEEFWGFAVVIMDLPDALAPLTMSEIEKSGYWYQISCEVDGKQVVVDQSPQEKIGHVDRFLKKLSGTPGEDYIGTEIRVPNHIWQLRVVPARGWVEPFPLVFKLAIGAGFVFLLGVVLYLVKKQESQMAQFATTDELTGLFNRRRLKEYMDIRCRDEKVKFAMFYIDLDRFKAINDTMGHACGDAVLIETGRRLKAGIGKEGSVYRIGGDEFIALMELEVSDGNCQKKKLMLEERLEEEFFYEKHPVAIRASIGYSVFPDEETDLDGLLKRSDSRMYEEKKQRSM